MRAREAIPSQWNMVVQSLSRPYPVSFGMIALVSLVPCYIFIAHFVSHSTLHRPEVALDRILPLQPAWGLVYGSLYLFLIVLPVFVVREPDHIRRTVSAYLMVWTVAYVCFVVYPTAAPRASEVAGTGFASWGLRFLYEADPPYNCFPSLHVAHSFVSALTCHLVNRRIGIFATICAVFVALSTLFTKQHYVLDVVAGVLLAGAAYVVFLRNYRRELVSAIDQRLAPVFALGTVALSAISLGAYWIAYVLSGKS
jgi:membrane-associated phospholipid phosphatase